MLGYDSFEPRELVLERGTNLCMNVFVLLRLMLVEDTEVLRVSTETDEASSDVALEAAFCDDSSLKEPEKMLWTFSLSILREEPDRDDRRRNFNGFSQPE